MGRRCLSSLYLYIQVEDLFTCVCVGIHIFTLHGWIIRVLSCFCNSDNARDSEFCPGKARILILKWQGKVIQASLAVSIYLFSWFHHFHMTICVVSSLSSLDILMSALFWTYVLPLCHNSHHLRQLKREAAQKSQTRRVCQDKRATRAARERDHLWRQKLTETQTQTVRITSHFFSFFLSLRG